MHLVDTITWVGTDPIRGEVKTTLRSDGPYFRDSGFKHHWLIELCAQASAALFQVARTSTDGNSSKASNGYLISVRDFEWIETVSLNPGDELLIQVVFESLEAPLGQSRSEVTCGGIRLAHGLLSFLMDG